MPASGHPEPVPAALERRTQTREITLLDTTSRAPAGALGRRVALAVVGAALAASVLPASASAATFVGVSGDNLISFSSNRPDIVRTRAITGLPNSETIVGLDRRPANGQIYGLGISSRIYTISRTGQARPVGPAFTPAVFGGSFGFDFNPVVDAIRITSDGDLNARVNPGTGAVAGSDTPLAYRAAGALPADPNFGRAPTVTGSAYTNNRAGAPSTQLLDIDSGLDVLARQDPPNSGTLNTIGRLGVNATGSVTYDIAPNGTGYATFRRSGRRFTELFAINPSTGRARATGRGAARVRIGRRTVRVPSYIRVRGSIRALTIVG